MLPGALAWNANVVLYTPLWVVCILNTRQNFIERLDFHNKKYGFCKIFIDFHVVFKPYITLMSLNLGRGENNSMVIFVFNGNNGIKIHKLVSHRSFPRLKINNEKFFVNRNFSSIKI